MRDDTPTSTYVALLLAVALLLPSSTGVDWHAVALWATSTVGLALAMLVAFAGCVAVSSATRRRQPRLPRVRRRDRPLIGQPAYWATA